MTAERARQILGAHGERFTEEELEELIATIRTAGKSLMYLPLSSLEEGECQRGTPLGQDFGSWLADFADLHESLNAAA